MTQHHIYQSPTRIEERERRVYKDAHASQYSKVRHFPALSQVSSGSDNIILLQDAKPNANTGPVKQTRMERIPSRVSASNTYETRLGSKSMLSEFRSAVLCKHTNALRETKEDDREEIPKPQQLKKNTTKPIFNTGNAHEAKSLISRQHEYDYPSGIHSHAERVISPRQQARNAELKRLHQKAQWTSTNASNAKKSIEVDYYMNSPDQSTPSLDRKYIRDIVRLTVQRTAQSSD